MKKITCVLLLALTMSASATENEGDEVAAAFVAVTNTPGAIGASVRHFAALQLLRQKKKK